MNNRLTVSLSPHNYGKNSVRRLMYDVIIALLPALAVSFYFFGIGALIVTITSIVAALFCEYVITKFMLKKTPTLWDGSAIITGLLLAFNVPSNLPIWITIIGAFVAIGIGKMSFGGLGNNPFNPALVGRVFLLISFPAQMTSWPKPLETRMTNWLNVRNEAADALTGATPLDVLQQGVGNGEKVGDLMQKMPSYGELFYGQMGGSLGEVAGVVLILGLIYMLLRRVITWHIPVVTLATVAALTGVLHLIDPTKYADPLFHLLTGGILLGAIFMATDYATSPMSQKGMVVYAIGIGVFTVVIRIFGSYPEGVSFAILIMNAFVPLINMYMKPKQFGQVKPEKK